MNRLSDLIQTWYTNIVNVLYQGQGHPITRQGQTRQSVINERFWL